MYSGTWSLWYLSVLEQSHLHLFCLVFSGTLLCAMHKAQRDEVPGVVWRRSLPAPGGLPWPDRECDGAQGRLCLQAALRSLPAAVREQDALWSKTSSVFQLRKLRKKVLFLFFLCTTSAAQCNTRSVPNYPKYSSSCYCDDIFFIWIKTSWKFPTCSGEQCCMQSSPLSSKRQRAIHINYILDFYSSTSFCTARNAEQQPCRHTVSSDVLSLLPQV